MKNTHTYRVLITREPEDGKILANRLENLGFIPILFPTIKTVPLDFDTKDIASYDIFIFGSKKGVKYFFQKISDRLEELKDREFIVVGEKTAEKLKNLGFTNIKIPEVYSSEGVLNLLKNNWNYYKNKKILFPKAKRGIDLLEKTLPNVKPLYVYETLFNKPKNIDEVKSLFENKKIKAVIFTSPSTFLGFKYIFEKDWKSFLKESKVISIGKTTGKTLKEHGITDFYIPKKSTVESILDLIQELFKD